MTRQKTLDLVIFGATGHTGSFVVREMSNVVKNYPDIKWAVAGRSASDLTSALHLASQTTGYMSVALPALLGWRWTRIVLMALIEGGRCPALGECRLMIMMKGSIIIIANVNDDESLRRMCGETRVVVNCCGPYVRYGERVVAAAVATGTHHLDISAENHFTRLLEKSYDEAAKKAGVFVVNACGLSSVPVDVGVILLEKNFEGTLSSAESYMTTHRSNKMLMENWKRGVIRYSSWECMVDSIAKSAYTNDSTPDIPVQSELKHRGLHKYMDRWCLPYPISDSFIVSRSQKALYKQDGKRPIQYKPYLVFPNIISALGALMIYVLINVLVLTQYTGKLLLMYPKLFSFGMVTYTNNMERVNGGSQFDYVLIGRGWSKNKNLNEEPDKNIQVNITVSGEDPAYDGTAVALLRCAVTILYERENMPAAGGVMTPGYAFYKTNLLERLQENTYKYEIKVVP